jgi:purine-binding chemotaxis protein CheW
MLKIAIFKLKDEEYGLPISEVRSIERMQPITRVPSTPQYIKGVINLRGVVTPIIDMRRRFDIQAEDYTDSTRIIIVGTPEMEAGLIVDAAKDVIDTDGDMIQPPPEVIGSIESDCIKGVVKVNERLIILLNLEKALTRMQVGGENNDCY